MNASDFRIEQIEKCYVNGSPAKAFRAFKRDGNVFLFIGQFFVSRRVANKNLWSVAAAA